MILVVSQLALAQRQYEVATGESILDIDKTAPGTKYDCTLAIYYADKPETPSEDDRIMYFFIRLRKGYELSAYSNYVVISDYYDTGEQQDLIGDFIRETVIPAEYGCTFGADCPPCALKSADHIVDIGDATQFTIMDIIIAVQD